MKLTIFEENNPFAVSQFPFDDMYIQDAKFVKIAKKNNLWLGVLVGDYLKYLPNTTINEITSLDLFLNLQTNRQVLKSEIIEKIYPTDVQIKILRDKEAGRNIDKFNEFDQFVQSIP